jgi:hypothetical protein
VEINIENGKKEENLQSTMNNQIESQKMNLVEEAKELAREEYPKEFNVYPGEIVEETDESSIDTKITQTKLDFYSVKKDDFESEYIVINSDTVEKFELDPNFNYSEHVYTPRYNFS